MNNTVGAEDIHRNDAAVEVDAETVEANLEGNTLLLLLVGEIVDFEQGWGGVREEDAAGGVESIDDVVRQQLLQLSLVRLRSVLWDLFESLVGWCKYGVVCLCRVQRFYEIGVLVDELRKLLSVLALGNKLVYGLFKTLAMFSCMET